MRFVVYSDYPSFTMKIPVSHKWVHASSPSKRRPSDARQLSLHSSGSCPENVPSWTFFLAVHKKTLRGETLAVKNNGGIKIFKDRRWSLFGQRIKIPSFLKISRLWEEVEMTMISSGLSYQSKERRVDRRKSQRHDLSKSGWVKFKNNDVQMRIEENSNRVFPYLTIHSW